MLPHGLNRGFQYRNQKSLCDVCVNGARVKCGISTLMLTRETDGFDNFCFTMMANYHVNVVVLVGKGTVRTARQTPELAPSMMSSNTNTEASLRAVRNDRPAHTTRSSPRGSVLAARWQEHHIHTLNIGGQFWLSNFGHFRNILLPRTVCCLAVSILYSS